MRFGTGAHVDLSALLERDGVDLTAALFSESQARADEYWLDEYGVRDAWKASRGEGATIAIIDTGVDGLITDYPTRATEILNSRGITIA